MAKAKLSKQEVVCDKCGDLIPMNKVHICKRDGEKCSTENFAINAKQKDVKSSPPSCLDEIPTTKKVLHNISQTATMYFDEPINAVEYKRDIQEMVIPDIVYHNKYPSEQKIADYLKKKFNITDAMIEEYKQKEARG